jgi:hypothetical protein
MKNYEMKSEYYSIGFLRDDYDFEIMATLNNGGGVMGNSDFAILLENTLKTCQSIAVGENVVALPRQDTPDLINLEDEELEKHFNITEAMLYEKV